MIRRGVAMAISRRTLASGLLLLVCLISPVPSASARTARSADAQPAPASGRPAELAEVLQGLRVDTVPADYVLLIDTSRSMDQAGLYGPVRRSLRTLLDALDSSDHVSLITFDAHPTLRYSGTATAESGPLQRLPAAATGASTDIGAAIGAGLRELERPYSRLRRVGMAGPRRPSAGAQLTDHRRQRRGAAALPRYPDRGEVLVPGQVGGDASGRSRGLATAPVGRAQGQSRQLGRTVGRPPPHSWRVPAPPDQDVGTELRAGHAYPLREAAHRQGCRPRDGAARAAAPVPWRAARGQARTRVDGTAQPAGRHPGRAHQPVRAQRGAPTVRSCAGVRRAQLHARPRQGRAQVGLPRPEGAWRAGRGRLGHHGARRLPRLLRSQRAALQTRPRGDRR